MKKLSQASDLGFAPFFKSDLAGIFNKEMWDAIEALLSPYNADVQGIVVSGCVTTNNAGNFDMTAGIVYLNGEFMKIAAATNQPFTKYIAPIAPINDTRIFLDTTSHVVTIDKQAGLVGSIPGSGQYISIASLTDLDDRRWINGAVAARIAAEAVISGGIWVSTNLANTDVQNQIAVNATSIGTSKVWYRIGEKETFISLQLQAIVFGSTPSILTVTVPVAIRNILNQELPAGVFAKIAIINSAGAVQTGCMVLYDGTSKLTFTPFVSLASSTVNVLCFDLVSRFTS